jgi:hypothetical protein
MAVEADLRGLSTRRVKLSPMERRIVDTILRRIDKLERDRWTKLQLILPCCCDLYAELRFSAISYPQL